MLALSVIIPARNEEAVLHATVAEIVRALESAGIAYEVVIVDDSSTDGTRALAQRIGESNGAVRAVQNPERPGLGSAVRCGIRSAKGRFLAIMMADGCDDAADLVAFYRCASEHDLDCVFGTRFASADLVQGYPASRKPFTRLGNILTSFVTGIDYDDFTNAFKLYRTDFVTQLEPFERTDFSFSLELSMKAILFGARYEVVPNSWSARSAGSSKFRLVRHSISYLRTLASCIRFGRAHRA